jgi:hypothetical protein
MLLNAGDFNLNFMDKKMELSKIISTSVAIGTLAFAANSFAVPTYLHGQADTGAESLNLTDLYSGGSADSFAVTNNLFSVSDAFGIYEFTDVGGTINLGATLEVLSANTVTPIGYSGPSVNQVNVTFDQNTGYATNDSTLATALIDNTFGVYALFGTTMVYSHASLNLGGADLVGIFDISAPFPGLDFEATFDNNGVEAALKVAINDVAIPEPSIIALFGLGLVGAGVATRRKQKQA